MIDGARSRPVTTCNRRCDGDGGVQTTGSGPLRQFGPFQNRREHCGARTDFLPDFDECVGQDGEPPGCGSNRLGIAGRRMGID